MLRKFQGGVRRGPPVVRDRQVAGTPEETSRTTVERAVDGFVRKDLVNRPYEAVAEEPCTGQAGSEERELRP